MPSRSRQLAFVDGHAGRHHAAHNDAGTHISVTVRSPGRARRRHGREDLGRPGRGGAGEPVDERPRKFDSATSRDGLCDTDNDEESEEEEDDCDGHVPQPRKHRHNRHNRLGEKGSKGGKGGKKGGKGGKGPCKGGSRNPLAQLFAFYRHFCSGSGKPREKRDRKKKTRPRRKPRRGHYGLY